MVAHLGADLFDSFFDVIGHRPVTATTTDVMHEAGKHLLTLERVGHFRMKLHGVEPTCLIRHSGNRRRCIITDDLEARRQLGDFVTVAHPDVEQAMPCVVRAILQALEQLRMATGTHFGITEFALVRALYLAAQLFGHRLHAIADTQHGNTQFEDGLRCLPVRRFVDGVRTTRQDDALRLEFAHKVVTHVKGMQLTVDLLFPNTTRDELRQLGTEIENEDLLVRAGHNWFSNG